MSKPAGGEAAPVKELQVINLPELITMSGGANSQKYVNKFISQFEEKSLNETLKQLHEGWLTYDVFKLEFFSHKAKGASLYSLVTQPTLCSVSI